MPKILAQLTVFLTFTILASLSVYATERSKSGIIVCISFSMPAESIKGWMNEAAKIHAPVVIRGLINNSFRETLKKMNELASDNKGGIQLDPMLFREYQIRQVPAIVVSNGSTYDIVYGDTHLDYALQTFINKNDDLSPIARNALQRMGMKAA